MQSLFQMRHRAKTHVCPGSGLNVCPGLGLSVCPGLGLSVCPGLGLMCDQDQGSACEQGQTLSMSRVRAQPVTWVKVSEIEIKAPSVIKVQLQGTVVD